LQVQALVVLLRSWKAETLSVSILMSNIYRLPKKGLMLHWQEILKFVRISLLESLIQMRQLLKGLITLKFRLNNNEGR